MLPKSVSLFYVNYLRKLYFSFDGYLNKYLFIEFRYCIDLKNNLTPIFKLAFFSYLFIARIFIGLFYTFSRYELVAKQITQIIIILKGNEHVTLLLNFTHTLPLLFINIRSTNTSYSPIYFFLAKKCCSIHYAMHFIKLYCFSTSLCCSLIFGFHSETLKTRAQNQQHQLSQLVQTNHFLIFGITVFKDSSFCLVCVYFYIFFLFIRNSDRSKNNTHLLRFNSLEFMVRNWSFLLSRIHPYLLGIFQRISS